MACETKLTVPVAHDQVLFNIRVWIMAGTTSDGSVKELYSFVNKVQQLLTTSLKTIKNIETAGMFHFVE
jgi:hypothetical protein